MPYRLVVLASGVGTLLGQLIQACSDGSIAAQIAAVGADRDGTGAIARAETAGIPTFICRVRDYSDRASWDRALTQVCADFDPDLVISAGFLKLFGPHFLEKFADKTINSHPALLPSFPGLHGVRDALAYGVKVTGCTVFFVDAGLDSGPVIAQAAVPVRDDDDEETLTERVKAAERTLLTQTVAAMVARGWSVTGRAVRLGDQPGGSEINQVGKD
jgi:formyltetrahydrofolate-dependent phosphoribosylglycinamide formyltransferase